MTTAAPAAAGRVAFLRPRATLLAALATALTTTALRPVFGDGGWVLPVLGSVVVVAAVAAAARALRVPAPLQPLAVLLGVAGWATLLYARSELALGVLPGPSAARRLGAVVGQGLLDVEQQAAPVPSTTGLVVLAVLGVGAVALLVDLAAVGLRRPALAGLPLLALVSVPAGTLENGVGRLPFVLGAAGWLLLLLDDASARVGRWGVALRSGSATDDGLGRVGRRIGVASVGLTLVVTALVPGLDSRLFTSGSGTGLGGSRTTFTYNPLTELAGQLRLPTPRTLLTYRTDDPSPDYLRMTTLDRFSDGGWSSSALTADVRRDAVSKGVPQPQAVAGARPVTTSLRVGALGGPWLPVPARPTRVDVAGPWLWDRRADTVFSTRTRVDRLDAPYRVTTSRISPDPAVLRASPASGPPELAAYATPPRVSPYVLGLTREVTARATSDYDKVVALQAFLRDPANGFVYSEDASVAGSSGQSPLEAFLRGRRGFCEQYSSAMAAMVRVLGLPARVAVGFTAGTRQPDGSWQVTTSDAHAWPEVWFPSTGWLRFEPTPRAVRVTVPSYSLPPAPAASDGPAAAPQPVTPSAAAQDPAAGATPRQGPDETAGGGAVPGGGGTSPRGPLAGGAAAAAVVAAPALLAALRRRKLWRAADPEAAWAHVVEDAVDVGHRWRTSQSPRAAADRLVQERGLATAAATALHRLAAQVHQARYGRPGTHAAVPVEQLRRDVHAVRSGLLASVPAGRRWRARLLPPSALRWAATAAGRRVADLLDRVDAVAGQLQARVRRRTA